MADLEAQLYAQVHHEATAEECSGVISYAAANVAEEMVSSKPVMSKRYWSVQAKVDNNKSLQFNKPQMSESKNMQLTSNGELLRDFFN